MINNYMNSIGNMPILTSTTIERSVTYLSSVDNNSFIIGSILKSNIVLSKYSHDFSQLGNSLSYVLLFTVLLFPYIENVLQLCGFVRRCFKSFRAIP